MKLRHIGIIVFDIERAIRFYTKIFGMELVKKEILEGDYVETLFNWKDTKLTYAKLKSKGSKVLLELWHFWKPVSTDFHLSHLAFTVDNIDEIYNKLKEDKISFLSPPIMSPDKKVKVCFCRDKEGTLLEIVQELKK